MNEDSSLSTVLPAYNESAHLADTVTRIAASVAELGVAYEIIVVDDGSNDPTWDIVSNVAALDPHVRGISLSRNFGKEAAMLAGLEASRGQALSSSVTDVPLCYAARTIDGV